MLGHVAGTKGPFLMRHVCASPRDREREREEEHKPGGRQARAVGAFRGKAARNHAGRHYLSIPGSRGGSRGITGVRALIAREGRGGRGGARSLRRVYPLVHAPRSERIDLWAARNKAQAERRE